MRKKFINKYHTTHVENVDLTVIKRSETRHFEIIVDESSVTVMNKVHSFCIYFVTFFIKRNSSLMCNVQLLRNSITWSMKQFHFATGYKKFYFVFRSQSKVVDWEWRVLIQYTCNIKHFLYHIKKKPNIYTYAML